MMFCYAVLIIPPLVYVHLQMCVSLRFQSSVLLVICIPSYAEQVKKTAVDFLGPTVCYYGMAGCQCLTKLSVLRGE